MACAARSVLPELSLVLISMSSLKMSRAVESQCVRARLCALAIVGATVSSNEAAVWVRQQRIIRTFMQGVMA